MRLSKAKHGMSGGLQLFLIGVAVIVVGGGALTVLFGGGIAGMAGLFSLSEDGSERMTEGKFSYADSNVKETLQGKHFYNGTDLNPTFYIYETNTAGDPVDSSGSVIGDVDNFAVSAPSGYVDTGVASGGTYTMQELPGTYKVRAELSGYYTKLKDVVVPASGDVALTDYNAEPQVTKFDMETQATLSLSTIDMGVSTTENKTGSFSLVGNLNVNLGNDETYILDEIKFQEDATYAFATDTDGDNTYDEGISKFEIIFDGQRTTLFDKSANVDEFESDNVASIVFDTPKKYTETETISVRYEVTSQCTNTTLGDADECLGDGEDFIDSFIMLDQQGTSATTTITG